MNTVKVTFNEALERTCCNIHNFRPTLITGRAGTGKSTLIKRLKEEFPRSCLGAPTNIAAKNIGGRTAHNIFHLPNPDFPDNVPRQFKNSRLMIFDECSMMGMNNMLKPILDCSKKSNIVLVGDFAQLQPVNDESILPFLENNQDIDKLELIENFRQAEDPEYLKICDEVRKHGFNKIKEFVKSRTIPLVAPPDNNFVYLATLNVDVNAYVKENKFKKYNTGILVRGCNNRSQIKNNEFGIVVGILPNYKLWVRIFGKDDIISRNSKNEQFAEVFFSDVKIAEASTIHGIQGKTLFQVVINCNQIHLFPNALYVAMSRVRRAKDVYFIDGEGDRYSKKIFTSRERRTGVKTSIESAEKNKKNEAPFLEEVCNNENSYIDIKKPVSNEVSVLLLNPYYIDKDKFSKWKRNSFMERLGFIKRARYCSKDRFGLYIKEKYEYKEIKPLPFWSYTPDYRKPWLYSKEVSVLESLNPMKSNASPETHLDKDCYSTTRFLFEIDIDDKGKELKYLTEYKKVKWRADYKALGIELKLNPIEKKGIVNRMTFSGNVSYHCIVETSYEVPDYKAFWHHINNKYFLGRADFHCATPSRWTRTPGQVRLDTGKLQRSIYKVNAVFDPTSELAEMAEKQERDKTAENEAKRKPQSRNEKFKEAASIYLASKRRTNKGSKWKPEAQELIDGIFSTVGDHKEVIRRLNIAINCLHGYGYSSQQIGDYVDRLGNDEKGKSWRRKVNGYVYKNRSH